MGGCYHDKGKGKSSSELGYSGKLFGNFTYSYRQWELLMIVRKCALVIISRIASPLGAQAQSALCLVLYFFFFMIETRNNPRRFHPENELMQGHCLILICQTILVMLCDTKGIHQGAIFAIGVISIFVFVVAVTFTVKQYLLVQFDKRNPSISMKQPAWQRALMALPTENLL